MYCIVNYYMRQKTHKHCHNMDKLFPKSGNLCLATDATDA